MAPTNDSDFAALFFIAITFCIALVAMLWFFEHIERTMRSIDAREREIDEDAESDEPETRR